MKGDRIRVVNGYVREVVANDAKGWVFYMVETPAGDRLGGLRSNSIDDFLAVMAIHGCTVLHIAQEPTA